MLKCKKIKCSGLEKKFDIHAAQDSTIKKILYIQLTIQHLMCCLEYNILQNKLDKHLPFQIQ